MHPSFALLLTDILQDSRIVHFRDRFRVNNRHNRLHFFSVLKFVQSLGLFGKPRKQFAAERMDGFR
jgi:hypothetical protein